MKPANKWPFALLIVETSTSILSKIILSLRLVAQSNMIQLTKPHVIILCPHTLLFIDLDVQLSESNGSGTQGILDEICF